MSEFTPAALHADPLASISARLRQLGGQFLRYVVVGGVAFACDYWTLMLLDHAGWPYLQAAGLGFGVGLWVNYVLSVRFVFREHRFARRGLEFLLFAAIGMVGLVINEAMLYALVSLGGISLGLAKCVTAGTVLLYNFGARRALLFTRTSGNA